MKKIKLNSLAASSLIIFLITGCSKKDESTPSGSNSGSINTSNGIFVINEGTTEALLLFIIRQTIMC
jgi:hypothetical protein